MMRIMIYWKKIMKYFDSKLLPPNPKHHKYILVWTKVDNELVPISCNFYEENWREFIYGEIVKFRFWTPIKELDNEARIYP